MNIAQIVRLKVSKELLITALGIPPATVITDIWVEEGDPTQVNYLWMEAAHSVLPSVEMGVAVPEYTPLFEVVEVEIGGKVVEVVRLIKWNYIEE